VLHANTPAPPSCPCLALCTDPCRASSSCLVWPSWAGPRAGPSSLRSTSAAAAPRAAPARGPRLAATHSVRVGPGRISAPRAGGAAAGGGSPGARPAPHLSAPLACVPGSGSPTPRAVFRVELRARGPTGPAAPPSAVWLHFPAGGREGDVSPLPGLHSDGPLLWGLRGDVSFPSPSCARGTALVAHSYHPSWDKQVSTNEASLPDSLCSQASVARPREISPG
jgi:hypothetical protein